jgi:hypothetical protein
MRAPKAVKFEDVEFGLYKGIKNRIYSEQWLVNFQYKDKQGFWTGGSQIYSTVFKGMGEDVKNQFKKDFPHFELINVKYQ